MRDGGITLRVKGTQRTDKRVTFKEERTVTFTVNILQTEVREKRTKSCGKKNISLKRRSNLLMFQR